jgi:hypothetical protein
MTTSNLTTWNANTSQIITYAMKYLGALGETEQPTAEEYNDCLWVLNAMIKQWIVKNDYAPGLKMWLRQRGFAFLANNTGTYVLGSAGGTGASYWTNTYQKTTVGANNIAGATSIKVVSTSAMIVQPQAASNAPQTIALQPNQIVGIQLDSGNIYWTTVSVVTDATTFTIPGPGLPSASNNRANLIFAFTKVATPPQVIENVILRDAQNNDTPVAVLTLNDWITLPSKQAPGYTGDPVAVYYEPDLFGFSGQGVGTLYLDVAGAQDTSKVLLISYVTEIQDFVNPADDMCFPKEWAMALVRGLARSVHSMFNTTWSQAQETETNQAIRFARNANNDRSTMGFIPGNRGQEVVTMWR